MARRTIQEYTPVVGMRLVPVGLDPVQYPNDVAEIIETRGEGDALEIRVQRCGRRVWQRKNTWAERYWPVEMASEPVQSALPLNPLAGASTSVAREDFIPPPAITEERVREIVDEQMRAMFTRWLGTITTAR